MKYFVKIEPYYNRTKHDVDVMESLKKHLDSVLMTTDRGLEYVQEQVEAVVNEVDTRVRGYRYVTTVEPYSKVVSEDWYKIIVHGSRRIADVRIYPVRSEEK